MSTPASDLETLLTVHAEAYASGRQADGEDVGNQILAAVRALTRSAATERAQVESLRKTLRETTNTGWFLYGVVSGETRMFENHRTLEARETLERALAASLGIDGPAVPADGGPEACRCVDEYKRIHDLLGCPFARRVELRAPAAKGRAGGDDEAAHLVPDVPGARPGLDAREDRVGAGGPEVHARAEGPAGGGGPPDPAGGRATGEAAALSELRREITDLAERLERHAERTAGPIGRTYATGDGDRAWSVARALRALVEPGPA